MTLNQEERKCSTDFDMRDVCLDFDDIPFIEDYIGAYLDDVMLENLEGMTCTCSTDDCNTDIGRINGGSDPNGGMYTLTPLSSLALHHKDGASWRSG